MLLSILVLNNNGWALIVTMALCVIRFYFKAEFLISLVFWITLNFNFGLGLRQEWESLGAFFRTGVLTLFYCLIFCK